MYYPPLPLHIGPGYQANTKEKYPTIIILSLYKHITECSGLSYATQRSVNQLFNECLAAHSCDGMLSGSLETQCSVTQSYMYNTMLSI